MDSLTEEKNYIISKLKEILKDKVEFALLFGSINKENYNSNSDIDVAVFLKPEFYNTEQIIKLRKELAYSFIRDVDLVILNDADTIITMQAIANGSLIIDNGKYTLFKARKISEYLDFKMSRKIIEDNMLNGRLYV